MAWAFDDGFRDNAGAIVLIGSDCPGLSPEVLASAFDSLGHKPVVLGPAADGGYYLVGLVRPLPELFRGISWGGDRVLAESVENLKRIGIAPLLLPELADIDRPTDLEIWRRLIESEATGPHKVSVIIPALNEEGTIFSTLQSVQRDGPHEVVVVDGGSRDKTSQIAGDSGARVISSKPGRAKQMNAGVAKATGTVLLFLHADTVLPPSWHRLVLETLSQPGIIAGAFGFQIGDHLAGKRIVEWGTNWRSRWWQMPYGDQGLFLKRAIFEEEGGFAELPIMEDYEFIRRLRRRGRIVTLGQKAITSGRRWRRLGLLQTMVLNQMTILGYHLGFPPGRLAHFYRKAEP
jgi:rSAM/selenodomain-associated transferase 2